jgi:hypothetical protein
MAALESHLMAGYGRVSRAATPRAVMVGALGSPVAVPSANPKETFLSH